MSKRKKKDLQNIREERIDENICRLADDLRKKGLEDNILIIAVAKIYANSVLLAYKEAFN